MRCRSAWLVALLLFSGANLCGAEVTHGAVPQTEYASHLENDQIALSFRGDDRGLSFDGLKNQITGHSYLSTGGGTDPTGAHAQDPLAAPFLILLNRGKAPTLLSAARDISISRWTSTGRTLRVRFMVRGLFVEGELSVLLGESRSFWSCTLRNFSADPARFDFIFPAIGNLHIDPSGADQLILPSGGGTSQPYAGSADVTTAYPGDLASPCAVLAGKNEGLFVVDANRSDLDRSPNQCYQRSVVTRGQWPNLAPASPVLGIANQVEIASGASVTVGPVIVGTFEGVPADGLADAAALRRPIVPGRTSSAWLPSQAILLERNGSLDLSAATRSAAPTILLSGYARNREDYLDFSDSVGGAAGFAKSIEAIHAAGGHVILAVDGLYLKRESTIGRTEQAREMAMRDADRSYPGAPDGLWTMCPATPEWRQWLANTCSRLLQHTGADGIEITSLCEVSNHPCFNINHHHPTPYVWDWGVRQLLDDLRTAIQAVNPKAVLLVAGNTDLARAFSDALVVDVKKGSDLSILRTVLGHTQLYARVPKDASAPEESTAALASGAGLVVAGNPSTTNPASNLQAKLPGILTGDLLPASVSADLGQVVGHLFSGSEYLMVVGNRSAQPYHGAIQLPYRVGSVIDPASSTATRPDANNRISVDLPPDGTRVWVVLPQTSLSSAAPASSTGAKP